MILSSEVLCRDFCAQMDSESQSWNEIRLDFAGSAFLTLLPMLARKKMKKNRDVR